LHHLSGLESYHWKCLADENHPMAGDKIKFRDALSAQQLLGIEPAAS
jgi:hypothetical protein